MAAIKLYQRKTAWTVASVGVGWMLVPKCPVCLLAYGASVLAWFGSPAFRWVLLLIFFALVAWKVVGCRIAKASDGCCTSPP